MVGAAVVGRIRSSFSDSSDWEHIHSEHIFICGERRGYLVCRVKLIEEMNILTVVLYSLGISKWNTLDERDIFDIPSPDRGEISSPYLRFYLLGS